MYSICFILFILSLVFFVMVIIFTFVEKRYYASNINNNTSIGVVNVNVSNNQQESDECDEPVILESVGFDENMDIFSD